MTEALAIPQAPLPEAVEAALVEGDVSKLNAGQRMVLYKHMCESQGLNMFTRPFQLMKGQDGKLWYYAGKNAADQLRKVHHITIHVPSAVVEAGCYVVTAVASDPQGRSDIDIGVVSIEGLKGDARSNALMKAHTKAKRRVTLSMCGLSMLDESELDSVTGAVIYEDRPRDPQDFPSPAVQKALERTHAKDAEVQTTQEPSGPFVDSASPAPVSPAAPVSAPGAAANTAERKPRASKTHQAMTTKQLLQAIKMQFARLCNGDQQAAQDLSRHVFGALVGSWRGVEELSDVALREGLAKLEPMQREQPPAVPPRGPEGATTSEAPSSASGEEDVPDFPPPDGHPKEGPQQPPGEEIVPGPSQGEGGVDDPVPVTPPDAPRVVDGYISEEDVLILENWARMMEQHACYVEMTAACLKDGAGLCITPRLWERIVKAVTYRAEHPAVQA